MIIYKTTNKIDGKIYVGKDVKDNPTYLGSGFILKRAIKKYGKENFLKEILERCHTIEQLDDREKYWIAKLNASDRKIGYNLTDGGTGGDTFSSQPKIRKAEILEKRKQHFKVTKEYRDKLSRASKKTWKNPNHRKLVVEALKGRKIFWKDKISKSIKEWHKTHKTIVTDEQKQTLSRKMTGYEFKTLTNAQKEKIERLHKQGFGGKSIEKIINNPKVTRWLIIQHLKRAGVFVKSQKRYKINVLTLYKKSL